MIRDELNKVFYGFMKAYYIKRLRYGNKLNGECIYRDRETITDKWLIQYLQFVFEESWEPLGNF